MWSADASNYRRVPIGVVAPARRRGRRGGAVGVPGARRARAAGGRADLDRRPGGEHRRRPGLHARQPDPGDRPGRAHRPRRAGRGLRRRARRRRAARADVRPRPVHAQPLHARRDDRQQRVRVALGGVGQDRRQRRRPRRAHLPRRAAVAGADATGAIRAEPSIPAPCARWASGRPTTSAPASPTSPAASPATTWTSCCPSRVDLAKALVGTEGTCAVLTGATVRLVESPPARALAVLGFPDAYTAADHVMVVRALDPLTIEGMDAGLIAALRASNPVETASRAAARGRRLALRRDRRRDARRGARGRGRRRGGHEAVRALGAGGERTGADEGAVADPGGRRRDPDPLAGRRRGVAGLGGRRGAAGAVRRLPAGVRRACSPAHGRRGVYYGHFGDGCLHVRIDFDLASRAGIANFRAFLEDAADLAVAHGGSLSGEHGDGAARAELLPRMYPPPIIAGVRGVQGDLGPRRPAEPGPRRAAGAGWTTTCGSSSGCPPCATRPRSRSRTTAAASPAPPAAAWAWASASPRTAG